MPSSVQSFFFALSLATMFCIVGEIGTLQLAANHVLLNLAPVLVLPCMGVGLAAASLVGQALGRADPDDASRWAWDVVKVAGAIMATLALPMVFVPELILGCFIHEAETLGFAIAPLRLIALVAVLDAIAIVLQQALGGAGATRATMVVSIVTQWGLFLPLAWLLGPVLGGGLMAVWIAWPAT